MNVAFYRKQMIVVANNQQCESSDLSLDEDHKLKKWSKTAETDSETPRI